MLSSLAPIKIIIWSLNSLRISKICNNTIDCLTCNDGFFGYGNSCVGTCPPGFYVKNQTCQTCIIKFLQQNKLF